SDWNRPRSSRNSLTLLLTITSDHCTGWSVRAPGSAGTGKPHTNRGRTRLRIQSPVPAQEQEECCKVDTEMLQCCPNFAQAQVRRERRKAGPPSIWPCMASATFVPGDLGATPRDSRPNSVAPSGLMLLVRVGRLKVPKCTWAVSPDRALKSLDKQTDF